MSNGFLVGADAVVVAEAILSLLANPEEILEKSKKFHDDVASQHSLVRFAAYFEEKISSYGKM